MNKPSIDKEKYNRSFTKETSMLWTFVVALILLGAGLNSCSKDDPVKQIDSGLAIKRVSVPSSLDIAIGGDITIMGQGFVAGDQILLTLSSNLSNKHLIPTSTVTDEQAVFTLPEGVVTGKYSIAVVRSNKSQLLGSIMLNVVTDTTIPDKEGMTVKGVVSSDGKGVEGVVVSDGYEVTVTDADGIYYLPSKKKNRYVFISVPGNYEVNNSKNLPVFFQRLAGGASVEQKDFSLIKTDNTNHVVLAMADWHLAGRTNTRDVMQFTNNVLPDLNATIAEYKSKGVKVYGLTLGDLSWETFWYETNFMLPEYLEQMYKVDCTIFNVMGNHDNDPYASNDWDAALPFKELIAPNYYSFNLGDIHYIVLDNINYINTGGSQGNMGDRNYRGVVDRDQMEWLKKDLATIVDKNTPIVIGMHIPLYGRPLIDNEGGQTNNLRLDNGNELISVLSEFDNVHILSGHSHKNNTAEPSPSLMEHNTAAICATWWWTGRPGYSGNHICTDGTPGGYGVWEMDGKNIEWYYKSVGYEKDYQFRAYDLNTVHITAEKFAPNSSEERMTKYAGGYSEKNNNNEVLINIWGYDTQWEIDVTESGNALDVERVDVMDPLHIISYNAQRLNVGVAPGFATNLTTHMFKVKASSATSTLEIKATDRFGNIFTETMERPKEFSYLMK